MDENSANWQNIDNISYNRQQYDHEEEKVLMAVHTRRRKKPNNWLENKINVSAEDEDKIKCNNGNNKESYDNILIMESTESITNKAVKQPSYPALENNHKHHVNWTEVDDDDIVRGPEDNDYFEESRNMKSIELPKFHTK